jgi:hypothetical protein
VAKDWKFIRIRKSLYSELVKLAAEADVSTAKMLNIILEKVIDEHKKMLTTTIKVCYNASIAKAKAIRDFTKIRRQMQWSGNH